VSSLITATAFPGSVSTRLLLCVIEGLLGDDALFRHRHIAFVGVLVHGQVGASALTLSYWMARRRRGRWILRRRAGLLRGYLSEDLLLVELSEDLALFDVSVDVGVEAGDDA